MLFYLAPLDFCLDEHHTLWCFSDYVGGRSCMHIVSISPGMCHTPLLPVTNAVKVAIPQLGYDLYASGLCDGKSRIYLVGESPAQEGVASEVSELNQNDERDPLLLYSYPL